MVVGPWSSSRLACGERLLLRCDGNAGKSFLSTQVNNPSSRARRRKRGSSGCGRTLVLPLEWSRVCQELPELQQGCEGPFVSSKV